MDPPPAKELEALEALGWVLAAVSADHRRALGSSAMANVKQVRAPTDEKNPAKAYSELSVNTVT